MNNPRIIVPLDFHEPDQALHLIKQLDPALCRLKIGKELFTAGGPDPIRKIMAAGYDVFLDLKFHDIPNTVARACSAAARLGVWMVNVHAAGGREMLRQARVAIDESGHKPLLIGVTVLTSMSAEDLRETGISATPDEQVMRLAGLAADSGLDGVVCSPREVAMVRKEFGDDFCIVTPGIRPAGSTADDQKRIMTPVGAVQAGSDYLVIGRPITRAGNPLQALIEISETIDGG